MNILILTGFDDAMTHVGIPAAAGKEAYAARHGYAYECVRVYERGTHPSWQKLRLLQERISAFDAITWFDADTVITNGTIRIETLMADTILTVSCDWCAPVGDDRGTSFISMGNFILRNTPDTPRWLDEAQSEVQFANRPCWEQDAVMTRMQKNPWFNSQVTRLPRGEMNAVSECVCNAPRTWRPGDLLCHLTGIGALERYNHVPQYDLAHVDSITSFLPSDWNLEALPDKRHMGWLSSVVKSEVPRRMTLLSTRPDLLVGAFDAAGLSMSALDATRMESHDSIPAQESDDSRSVCRETPRLCRQDLLFIDGNHPVASVEAVVRHLRRATPMIVVASGIMTRNTEPGGAQLRSVLGRDGWHSATDSTARRYERTERGFLIATRDAAAFARIQKHRAAYCW